MKKFFLILLFVFFCTSIGFAQTSEGWIEQEVIPKCVVITSEYGLGTGIIATPDGYIVTNKHVVQGADILTVYLSDFRKHGARIVGYHSIADVAVIKIEYPEPLPFWDREKMIANPKMLFLGEDVYAVGHPFGIAWTITRGVISQRHKFGNGEVYWQTDTAINTGNSGGPLFNENCKLVGLNTRGIPPYQAENIAITTAVYAWIDEIEMIIKADIERQRVIEDIWEYEEMWEKIKRYLRIVHKD